MSRPRHPLRLVRARPEAAFTVEFDGREITVLPGRTVAAALWSDGTLAWRATRVRGEPRGVFCGIGICFDCLVTVNGVPNQRACLVVLAPGDVVRSQEGTGHDR